MSCQRLGVSSSPKSGLYRVCIYLRVGDSLVSEESPISYVLRYQSSPPPGASFHPSPFFTLPLLVLLWLKQVRAMFRYIMRCSFRLTRLFPEVRPGALERTSDLPNDPETNDEETVADAFRSDVSRQAKF